MSRGSFGEVYRGKHGEVVMDLGLGDDPPGHFNAVLLVPAVNLGLREGPPGTLEDLALSDNRYWQLVPEGK